MSHRNPLVFMRHMFDHAQEAVNMTKGKTRSDLNTA